MVEFAEAVLYMPLRGDLSDKRRAKMDLEPRFMDRIFLGLTDRSDEILVFGSEGVRKARTVRRRPEEERWRHDDVMSVRGTPLQPNPGSGDSQIKTKMSPGVADERVVGDPVTKEEVAREMGESRHPFHLMRKDVQEICKRIGYTSGCKGCKAAELNYNSRPVHTNA